MGVFLIPYGCSLGSCTYASSWVQPLVIMGITFALAFSYWVLLEYRKRKKEVVKRYDDMV